MQECFSKMCKEFGVRRNVKTEFFEFTSDIIQVMMNDLEKIFQDYKAKVLLDLERF